MEPIELTYLPVGSPPEIAPPCVSQVEMRDLLEAARRVEAGSQLVGKRLVVDEAVRTCRRDGTLVQVHGIERPAFQAGDLRADQRRTMCEIVRAALRKDLELTVTAGHHL